MPDEFYQFDNSWNFVLADGPEFCHWGGLAASRQIIEKLDISEESSILEVCCGQGGTLSLLPQVRQCVGLDLSERSLNAAKSIPSMGRVSFVCGDAYRLPFRNATFDRIYSQDGDAWMREDKHLLMAELARVTTAGGSLVYQTYCQSQNIPNWAASRTDSILRRLGYIETNVPVIEELPRMFSDANYEIICTESLHTMYSTDNVRMLDQLSRARSDRRITEEAASILEELLEWERVLFRERWWSGVLISARLSGERY